MERMLGCVLKAALLTCRGAWAMAGGTAQITPCPRSHQPVPGPSAQAQRGPGNSSRQEGKFRTLRRVTLARPVPGDPHPSWPGVKPVKTSQQQSTFWTGGNPQRGEGHRVGYRARVFQNCLCLVKVRKCRQAKGQTFGRNKCGENCRIRGSKGLVVCKWSTWLAMSLSLNPCCTCVYRATRRKGSACFCVFVLLECHLLTCLCRWSAKKPSVLTLGLSRVQ